MRLNTLILFGLSLVGLASTGSRVLAVYNDPAGDYVLNPSNPPGTTFDPGSRTFDAGTNAPSIAPDIQSISGVYDSSISSYVFSIKFYNNVISLPSTAHDPGTLDTNVAGYMDFVIGDSNPTAPSLADQIRQSYFLNDSYSPMPASDYFIDVGSASPSGSNISTFSVQNTADFQKTSQLGRLTLVDNQTFTITVPLAALNLSQPASQLHYSFVAFSDLNKSADFAPNDGSAYVVGVPEASSLTLLGIGGAGLALGFWRRRRRAA